MKGEDRKEEILNTAAQLFSERGYNAVSMRDLAEALGIKAASLYNHISSKQELLSTLIISVAEAFTTGMNEIISSKTSTVEKLDKVIDLHVKITIENSKALYSLNNDWMHLKDPDLSYFKDMRNSYEENFRKILKQGVKKKEIQCLNIEVMLFSILSSLRTLNQWYSKKQGIDGKELSAQMKQVLLQGIIKN